MFCIKNDITYINGENGKYDNKVKNDTVRYARNAVSNYLDTYSSKNLPKHTKLPQKLNLIKQPKTDIPIISKLIKNLITYKTNEYISDTNKYIEKSDKNFNKCPGIAFNMKYAEPAAALIDTIAPVAVAFEEMGKKLKQSVEEMTLIASKNVSAGLSDLVSAKSLDLNNDGDIDIGEYAASILVEDMISSNENGNLKATDVNGEITNKGENAIFTFLNKNNYEEANNIFKKVYSDFNLKEAVDRFTSDSNNMI